MRTRAGSLIAALLLPLALAGFTHADPSLTRSFEIAPGRAAPPVQVEIPPEYALVGVRAIGLECAVDGARFAADVAVHVGYQGFERGRHLAWLELRSWQGLPAGHPAHAARLTVSLNLAPASARPLARERVVPDWEASGPRSRIPPGETRLAAPVTAAAAAATAGGEGDPAGGGRTAQPFLPTQVPSLLGSPVAYLIITTEPLVPAFQTLADWKTASGVPAAVRTLDFIREQYPSAVDDPERIRLFIRDAYTRWGTRWVLLGGDTEILAPRYTRMAVLSTDPIPSDLYFSCLDGNWNADGDSTFADAFAGSQNPGDDADLLPEVWVGRAPVVTPADAGLFVKKTLAYATAPVADYMDNLLFFAEVITPQSWSPGQTVQFDGAEIVEQDLLPILDTAPHLHVARLYQNYTDPRWRPGSVPETRAAVFDSLALGCNIAVHLGHGYREVMSCGDANLTNVDVHALTNGDRLMNFYAINCTSNAIDFASIGEALMRAPSGGAVTNIGSTTVDYPTFGRIFQEEYFRLLVVDSVTAVGEAQGRQKLPFIGSSYYDGFDRLSQLSLLLLGDPELRIFTARPRELSVTAPDSIVAGEGSLAVAVAADGAPLPGARVTAWMPGREYRSGLTDDAGGLTLEFHPGATGPCSLTVTAFNARPWRGALVVAPGAPAALHAAEPMVLDDALAGRQGDDDGVPDAGEQVDVVVVVRNAGGAAAGAVTGTLGTSDPWVAITRPNADYGAIAPGADVTPAVGFGIAIAANCPDQREVEFVLDLAGDDGLLQQQRFRLLIHAPELVHSGHVVSEETGNGDGRPQPGETVLYAFRIRNTGSADAHALFGRLRNHDGLAVVLDSTFALPHLPAGAEATVAPVRFAPASAEARLELSVDDATGPRLLRTLDLGYPAEVTALLAAGGAKRVTLTWSRHPAPDVAGYLVYRGDSPAGPFESLMPLGSGRTSAWSDVEVEPLTQYFYRVTAVDSSGNESSPGATVSAMTSPGAHQGFPAFTRETSETPVALAPAAGGGQDILLGGNVLHLFHADGSAPVDADGSSDTPGDFTTLGRYYQGGGSFADLDGDGGRDVIGATWTSRQLLAFDSQGSPRPGFPVPLADPIWSSVAVGDLDLDGAPEMVFASLGRDIYAFRADGSEWLDGDANPATTGVFKRMNGAFNPGTPALADLLGDGQVAIVYASIDGFLYAWNPDGSSLPGFPANLGAATLGSVAVGRLDGPQDPPSIVIPAGNYTLMVRRADGSNRTGFPVSVPTTGAGISPSPALADMNGDGFLDIVYAATNGRVYVFDRNGAQVPPWTAASRFSSLTSGATRASAVVADIDGDGWNDVVAGDETGSLAALSGATGAMLPGFPIALAAEASGTPALCDCDGDGMSEIVAVDHGGTVHVWDYDSPFSPGGPAPWPQFRHDAQRTGSSEPLPEPVGVTPAAAGPPRTLELGRPHPNPAGAGVHLAYGIPGDQRGAAIELAIYDLLGRRVRTLVNTPARPGHGTARWDMRDQRGGRVAAGVYMVRLSAGARALTRKVVVLP